MQLRAKENSPVIPRKRVEEFEEGFIKKLPEADLKLKHYFSDGVYARELTIPAGTLLTGKIHKYENLNILSQGEMIVLTENGMKRVKAPFTVVSPPGTKRLAYAYTDCVWTTILATEEQDPEKIEAHFVADSEAQYLEFLGDKVCLLPQQPD